jgi:hypothetical protein
MRWTAWFRRGLPPPRSSHQPRKGWHSSCHRTSASSVESCKPVALFVAALSACHWLYANGNGSAAPRGALDRTRPSSIGSTRATKTSSQRRPSPWPSAGVPGEGHKWGAKNFPSCFHGRGNSGFSTSGFACRLEVGLGLRRIAVRAGGRGESEEGQNLSGGDKDPRRGRKFCPGGVGILFSIGAKRPRRDGLGPGTTSNRGTTSQSGICPTLKRCS